MNDQPISPAEPAATLYGAIKVLRHETWPAFSSNRDTDAAYQRGYADGCQDAAQLTLGLNLPCADDAEPLTGEWLIDMGFRSTKNHGYILRCRRMSMCVHLDGTISLAFASTYGGSFGTYEKFSNRGAVRRLASNLGFDSFGVPQKGPRFTREQRQKMHELQVEETWR